ncbi:hypothetical protein BpHYR1_024393 [Brachionus plicatilis]|uniref:RNA-directed DNA polymerase from mobile element jockey-like n=1 Tax=Brachionus plicatilis TaxID=10195 RepID=A0A3M7QSM7_BRAPC|nr:hypothetical protein BpHYR1_024393 [Brachionus plicatilis]
MCGKFGRLWTNNFNPTKSVIMFQNWIQKVNSLLYLGIPIGDHVFKENYWVKNSKKYKKLYTP